VILSAVGLVIVMANPTRTSATAGYLLAAAFLFLVLCWIRLLQSFRAGRKFRREAAAMSQLGETALDQPDDKPSGMQRARITHDDSDARPEITRVRWLGRCGSIPAAACADTCRKGALHE